MWARFLFPILLLSRPAYWALRPLVGELGAAALVQLAVLALALLARRPGDDVELWPTAAGADRARQLLVAAGAGVLLFLLSLPLYAVASAWFGSPSAGLRPTSAVPWLLAAVNAVAASFGEELAFRGSLWARWRRRWGASAAVLLSAAAFAVYHLDVVQLLPTFLLGLGLAWLVRRQRHLAGAMLAHLVFNGLGFALLALLPAP